jgi:hypothetical protein
MANYLLGRFGTPIVVLIPQIQITRDKLHSETALALKVSAVLRLGNRN